MAPGTVIADVTVERESPDPKKRVWHIAADAEQAARAQAGLDWLTLCGIRKPTRRYARKAWQLTDMEKCAVCRSLHIDRINEFLRESFT